MKVRANGIDIEVQDSGTAADGRPVALLIMGLGMQLVAWPPAVLEMLDQAGYRVVRFDNRDAGLSQHFNHLGTPNVVWSSLKLRLGWPVRSPYGLHDMAADALGVLDALGIAAAHVVGVSMGGMIGQRLALAAPQRVLSLTSIMSSSGARGLPQPDSRVLRVMMQRPKKQADRAVIVAHYLRVFKAIAGRWAPGDEAELLERVGMAVGRDYAPDGTVRQMVAIAADAARCDALAQIRCPTLVLHGRCDPLLPLAHGEDTARRIAGARFAAIDDMGHDLVQSVAARLMPYVGPFLHAQRAGVGA